MTKKGGERSGQFTPWDDIDVIALQNERTSAAGADGFLCLYRQDPDGEVLLHRSKVTGWSLDLKKLSEIARQHSPDVQVTERYIRDD